jgi:putative membrane protein
MKITNIDKEKIKLAIKEVELKTSGEIVPVILSQSDFYPAAHFRLALIIGIFSSLICYYTYDFDDPILLIWSQVLGLIVGYLLAYLPFLKRIFTTQKEINEEVYQRSLEIFYENKVSITRDRTGIMIYVSLLERKVEVLADCGINEKVDKDYWSELVKSLSTDISNGHMIDGIIKSINTCGEKLIESFPIKDDDTNEIVDELITDL